MQFTCHYRYGGSILLCIARFTLSMATTLNSMMNVITTKGRYPRLFMSRTKWVRLARHMILRVYRLCPFQINRFDIGLLRHDCIILVTVSWFQRCPCLHCPSHNHKSLNLCGWLLLFCPWPRPVAIYRSFFACEFLGEFNRTCLTNKHQPKKKESFKAR